MLIIRLAAGTQSRKLSVRKLIMAQTYTLAYISNDENLTLCKKTDEITNPHATTDQHTQQAYAIDNKQYRPITENIGI